MKFIDGDKDPSGFDQVLGGHRISLTDPGFRECEADLFLRVATTTGLSEQPGKRQAHFNPVGVGSIQGPRIALHRRFVVPQDQQSLSGGHQHFAVIAAFFRARNGFVRAVLLPELGIVPSHLRIEKRVIRTEAKGVLERIQRFVIVMQPI